MHFPNDPAVPPLGIYLREMKLWSHQNLYVNILTPQFIITRVADHPTVFPVGEWINWYIHTTEHCFINKIAGTTDNATTQIDLQDIILRERSQTQGYIL